LKVKCDVTIKIFGEDWSMSNLADINIEHFTFGMGRIIFERDVCVHGISPKSGADVSFLEAVEQCC